MFQFVEDEYIMLLWIIATLGAFFIKGLCGFANTLVFTSILAFGTTNINISPVELVLGYPTNFVLAWKNRRKLDKRIFVPLSFLVILGSLPGAFLLKNISSGNIKIVFGILVTLLGTDMLMREYDILHFNESKLILGIIGVISGVFCGMFGVGALLAAYIGRVTDSGDEFKANISAVFIVENTFRVILYGVMGIITVNSVKQSLILIPFMIAGLWAGIKCSKIIDDRVVRILVIVLLIISGVVMIVNNLQILSEKASSALCR